MKDKNLKPVDINSENQVQMISEFLLLFLNYSREHYSFRRGQINFHKILKFWRKTY